MMWFAQSANMTLMVILLPAFHCWATIYGNDVAKRGSPIYGRNGYAANSARFKGTPANKGREHASGSLMNRGRSTSGIGYGNGGSSPSGSSFEESDGYNSPTSSSNNDMHQGNSYSFAYDVQDPMTYNYHSRQETGKADPKSQVIGSYSLMEPDGSTRTVDYVADWATGFKATVRDKNGVTQHGYDNRNGNDDGSYREGNDGGSSGVYGGDANGRGGTNY